MLNQAADDRVRLRDLAVVRRVVRRMRLVDVKEEKEWLMIVRANPVLRNFERLESRPPMFADRARRGDGNRVIVEIETATDARLRSQNVRRDRRTGAIAVFAQCLLQRRKLR